jgi:hypothetical protein
MQVVEYCLDHFRPFNYFFVNSLCLSNQQGEFMFNEIKPFLNITQLLVLMAYLCFLINFNHKNSVQRVLLCILSLSFVVEILCLYLLGIKEDKIVNIVYSLNAIFHQSLWLLLMSKIFRKNYFFEIIILSFFLFGIINLLFLQGLSKFNHYTFIIGALLYLVIFILESFYQLGKENFSFFQSEKYILLFAPVIFFFGLSILLSFNSRILYTTKVLGSHVLYDVIGYFLNLVYYSFIIIYCFKQKRIRND